MGKGTFISEGLERFEAYSRELYEACGVAVHLARIRGARWEYVSGHRPRERALLVSSRQALAEGMGLLFHSSGQVDENRKREITGMVKALLREGGAKYRAEEGLSREAIVHFLGTSSPDEVERLFRAADEVRKKYVGEEVHLRGLIEASNICDNDCLYCGLRRSERSIKRYSLTFEEIFEAARFARSSGYMTVVIQTGESRVYPIDGLCRLVERIKKELRLAVTLSLGELERSEYAVLRSAGADRYLMRFETSDRELYARLRPGKRLESRMERLGWLRDMGYQVGSGIMIGLPGQTVESIASDIELFGELALDMVGNGPFIPNDNTPLADIASGGDLVSSLKLIALTRLLTRNAHIPATTALGSIDPSGRQRGLGCGANVLMPNCTPTAYRRHYLLYPGKICVQEAPGDCVSCVDAMVASCGRKVSKGYGHTLKRSS